LADLPLLGAAEQHQLLVEWNQTERDYPDRLCHQLFEEWAAQNPEAIALGFGEQQYTYQQLNNGSNQLANYLRKLGVGSETLVGICMEPSPVMVTCLLGILKAGGAYLPLDPTYPPERLQFMLEDAQVSVLLTLHDFGLGITEQNIETKEANDLPNLIQNLKVVCLNREWEAIAIESEEISIPDNENCSNLAYVVYTSGSTGKPKGVAVTHRAVNRLVCNTNYISLEPGDKVAQCSNISFDAATFEIWGALLNGAQLVFINREITLSPQDFAQEIRQQEISVLFLTTALFNQIVREVPDSFSSLRYLLFGGEAVDVRWVKAVRKHGAPEHLLHVYGPTENTTFTSWYEVQDVAATIPIGRAIANTQIYLLDTHLKPVPIGVTGEIYIGGDGLARGYLNRPELTAERFISNPFTKAEVRSMKDETENPLLTSSFTLHPFTKAEVRSMKDETENPLLTSSFTLHPSERLYKTGDLARYLPDGNLEFVGRIDDQVKLRGFRIELGEIETVLNQHPAVRETVVMMREDRRSDRCLVAYIVSNSDQNLTSSMRSFLKTKLPSYMIPAAFVVLEKLPLTPNGKVDRQALPSPDAVGLPEIEQVPRTSVEVELVQIWAEILGKQVGISDNFFELGGHSLLATQLVSRIRDRFGVQVPLRSLFETPTISGLAQYIEAMSGKNKDLQMASTETIASQNREEVEF
jgi:amino acid adenylation domain-containing protein